MTDKVLPSFGRTARSREFSAVFAYAGGSGEGIVWPSTSRLVEDSEGNLATGALGAYNHVSSSGLDVTFDTGEAIVRGAYTARDTQTTYSLPSSSTTTIYLGWKDSQADTVVIGEASDFGSEDPSLAVWTFTTDGSSVTGVTDERPMADAGYIAAASIKRGANLIDDGNENLAVSQGQGSGLNADTVRNFTPTELRESVYGDGSDGSISRSSSGNENGIINATTYEVQSGVTRTVSDGILVVHATNEIIINGTIDADGTSLLSNGATGDGNNGGNGNTGLGFRAGGGGGGGDNGVQSTSGDPGEDGINGGAGGAGNHGGDGGDTGTRTYSVSARKSLRNFIGSGHDDIYTLVANASGAGGGGGGSGSQRDGTPGAGGDGGEGGGIVLLVAPEIRGSGTITARGLPGQDGGDGTNRDGGGGGGGGGAGGSIIRVCSVNNFSGTTDVTGGAGGAKGLGESDGYDGGPGGKGEPGFDVVMG